MKNCVTCGFGCRPPSSNSQQLLAEMGSTPFPKSTSETVQFGASADAKAAHEEQKAQQQESFANFETANFDAFPSGK